MVMLYVNCFSQNTSKSLIEFSIVNGKSNYQDSDNVVLSVKNISNKPLYYIIGKAFYDVEYKKWIEFNMDIKNDPSLDLVGRDEIIPAHKLLLITVSLSKTSGKPRAKHGISKLDRFYLSYHTINTIITEKDPKLFSNEFRQHW